MKEIVSEEAKENQSAAAYGSSISKYLSISSGKWQWVRTWESQGAGSGS